MKIALTGDMMLGRLVAEAIGEFGPDYPLGNCAKILVDADFALTNLECVVSNKGKPTFPKAFHFQAPAEALGTLKNAGLDAVTLANNHILDYGYQAFFDMLEGLADARILYTGAGRNRQAAQRPVVLKKEIRVGVLAITDNEPGWEAKAGKAGIWYVPVDITDPRFDESIHQIKETKKKVDFLIVSAHVGPHFRENPDRNFVEFAHAILDAGANLYWGHSNHAFQGIEIYRGKPILYDSGDFVDDYAVDPTFRNDRSFIFILNLVGSGVESIKLMPTQIDNFQVNLATGESNLRSIKRMEKLCQSLGTRTYRQGEVLKVLLKQNKKRSGQPQRQSRG